MRFVDRTPVAAVAVIVVTLWLAAMLAYMAVMNHFVWDDSHPSPSGFVVGAGEAP